MPLTPNDIVNYPLKQAVRGYSVQQVDELLDRVADQLERLELQLQEARREAERVAARVDEMQETEVTLKRTLVTAQRAAEQTLEEARERAAEIVSEAHREAERIVARATDEARRTQVELRRDVDALEHRMETLRTLEEEYRSGLRIVAERHLRAVKEMAPVAPPAVRQSGTVDDTAQGRQGVAVPE
ncbi:MAG: DivIVA domain-containing protein [Actinobacteria bacterium]|nr:DivIVA domain-containing protein [Actinomycetota bacterium]